MENNSACCAGSGWFGVVLVVTQPENQNYLSPVGFGFVLNRAPNVMYFTQAATLPGITMGQAETDNPLNKISYPGEKLEWGEFSIRFKVDENMTNYIEIFSWMKQIGYPESTDQFQSLSPGAIHIGHEDMFSDATVSILTSSENPNVRVIIRNCYPVALSPLPFDVTQDTIEHLECEVSFKYRDFDIEKL
jgi:hypothetical protein